ncbi:MAG TPA: hypothetical protein VIJ01_06760 [Candidatus Angelobacter sp.]
MITGAGSDIVQAFAALVRSEIDDERVDLLRSALTFARLKTRSSILSITCGAWTNWPRALQKRSRIRTIPHKSLLR